MVYKFVSLKSIIAKVISDNDIQEENVRIADMLEWASEALESIGAFPQFIIKTTGRDDLPLLQLVNYQAELPYDFHSLIQVSYSTSSNGPFSPMRYGTGAFDHNPAIQEETESSNLGGIASTSDIITVCMQLFNISYAEAVEKIRTEDLTKSILLSLLEAKTNPASGSESFTTDPIYVIRGGYIKTNVEDGYLMVSYQAIPTDIEGYPLIPDTAAFRTALYWYINMKLLYPQWKNGQVRDAVYIDARRSWNYFCKQAYGDAMMPDRGQLESIKNSWLRLIPNINEQDTDFSHLGEQQVVYTHSTN